MEVHQHTHPDSYRDRKKWTHYFWEFLMLFLAVFCGFLAEYQLEHVIEHQREKKYVSSLIEDLKRDTADLSYDIQWWQMQNLRIDTVLYEFEKSTDTRDIVRLYRMVFHMSMFNTFEYHDRTVNQLRNAGFFRLFRKQNVADSLMDYDAQVKNTLQTIEDVAESIYMSARYLQDRIFNSKYTVMSVTNIRMLDSLYRNDPGKYGLRHGKEEEIFEYINRLQFYRGNARIKIIYMNGLRNKAKNLIEIIQSEYHLK